MNKKLKLSLLSLFLTFPALAEEKVIIQAGLTFLPVEAEPNVPNLKKNPAALREASIKEIKLKAHDTIDFKNEDTSAHNVFSPFLDLKSQEPGVEKKMQFDNPGTYEVRCMIHPKMKLKVTVE